MKKTLLVLAMIATVATTLVAQRFAYVDVEYILENLPEYQVAQQQLDAYAQAKSKEVDNKMKAIETEFKKFQAEQVLMTEQMKLNKIKEIEDLEVKAKDFQRSVFGPNGELFKKRQELIKPIQDKIFDKIQLLAKEKSFDFIFDKSSGTQMLFANEKHDRSQDIINALKNTK
jgi:outer membrane protein